MMNYEKLRSPLGTLHITFSYFIILASYFPLHTPILAGLVAIIKLFIYTVENTKDHPQHFGLRLEGLSKIVLLYRERDDHPLILIDTLTLHTKPFLVLCDTLICLAKVFLMLIEPSIHFLHVRTQIVHEAIENRLSLL